MELQGPRNDDLCAHWSGLYIHNIDETCILPQTLTSSIFIYKHIFVRVVPPAAEYDLYSRLCSDHESVTDLPLVNSSSSWCYPYSIRPEVVLQPDCARHLQPSWWIESSTQADEIWNTLIAVRLSTSVSSETSCSCKSCRTTYTYCSNTVTLESQWN